MDAQPARPRAEEPTVGATPASNAGTRSLQTIDGGRSAGPAAAEPAVDFAELGARARRAATALARTPNARRDEGLRAIAAAIRASAPAILAANAADLEAARGAAEPAASLDRLLLDPARVEGIAAGVEAVAALPDAVGRVLERFERPNGLVIERVSTPIGVVGVVFESRPNVTVDAGAICLKSGNAAVLRSGSDSFRSALALGQAMRAGLEEAGLDAATIQVVPTRDRAAVGAMLAGLPDETGRSCLDVLVPRGGKSLVARVQAEARVPVFAHLDGICHVYVHAAADLAMARRIVLNAKMRRVSVCGAAECLLVDRAAAATHLPAILDDLMRAGCEVRGDEAVRALDARIVPASPEDFGREFLAPILAVRVVDGIDEAIAHVETHGSHHTDAIVTDDEAAAARFLSEVDSAIVLHNASTQFADGGEFGFGAEIGIATGRLHARGPVGPNQLTTFNYRVRGTGQTRP